MQLVLPPPYPDELLCSVISRFAKQSMPDGRWPPNACLFGSSKLPAPSLGLRLNLMAKRTNAFWGLSAREIANRTTLFPFFAAYLPEERVAACLNAITSYDGRRASTSIGSYINMGRFRFCPSCRQQELDAAGEAYWHRSHHLPGVIVCHKHGCDLVDTQFSLKANSYTVYPDATETTATFPIPRALELRKDHRIMATKVAVRGYELLHGRPGNWPRGDVQSLYREAARAKGLRATALAWDFARISNLMLEMFGTEQLDAALLSGDDEVMQGRMRSILSGGNPPTFKHMLFQVFLQNIANVAPDGSAAKAEPPFLCPNPVAGHNGIPTAFHSYMKRTRRCAFCPCGCRFSFHSTDEKDPRKPSKPLVTTVGEQWVAAILAHRQAGHDKRWIARKFSLGLDYVAEMLELGRDPNARSDEELAFSRGRWNKLLEECGSITQACAADDRLYEFLRRYDPAWLEAASARKSKRRRPLGNRVIKPIRVDWVTRDVTYAELFRTAASVLRSEKFPRRISVELLLSKALGSHNMRRYLSLLPLSSKVISDSAESQQAFYERRLVETIEELHARDFPVSKQRIIALCALFQSRKLFDRVSHLVDQIPLEV